MSGGSEEESSPLQLDDIFCVPESPEEDWDQVVRATEQVKRTYGSKTSGGSNAYTALMTTRQARKRTRPASVEGAKAREKTYSRPKDDKRVRATAPSKELVQLQRVVRDIEEDFRLLVE